MNKPGECAKMRVKKTSQSYSNTANVIKPFLPEGLGEFLGAHGGFDGLQLDEHALQRQRHRVHLQVLRGHRVHGAPQRSQVEQALQQRVHVAGGALVPQPNHARRLFAVSSGEGGAVISLKVVRARIKGNRSTCDDLSGSLNSLTDNYEE